MKWVYTFLVLMLVAFNCAAPIFPNGVTNNQPFPMFSGGVIATNNYPLGAAAQVSFYGNGGDQAELFFSEPSFDPLILPGLASTTNFTVLGLINPTNFLGQPDGYLINGAQSAANLNITNAESQQPVALNVANFGAMPNGYIFTNISVTNIYLTCPTANFTGNPAVAVGSMIAINFAGANNRYFITRISNVMSATELGLSNSVVDPVTNLSFCAICTLASSLNNLNAFQTTLNQLTNFYSATVNIPPPIWYNEFWGTPLTSMGQCYMFVTNGWGVGGWENPQVNHALLIVPPLMANNPINIGNRAEVTIQGYVPWHWWGNGTGPSYISIPPNATALLVAALDDGQRPTNWLGPSFLDTRCYTNWQYETPDPSGNTYVPGNDSAVYLKNFTVFSSYDGGIVVANLLGSADGSGMENVNLLGGDQANNFNVSGRFLSYPYMRGNYPKDTNSIGVMMPGSNFGNYGTSRYNSITGQYIGMEAGQVQSENTLFDFCSNAVDMSYGGSINVDMRDVSFGGCFNGFTLIRQASHSPAQVYATVLTCGGNSVPSGDNFNLLYDQGFLNGAGDYFAPGSGHITLLGPVNAGAPINTTPGTTYNGGGILIDAINPETPGTLSILSGQLAIAANATFISTNTAYFLGGTAIQPEGKIDFTSFSGTAEQFDSSGNGMSLFFRNDAISTANLFQFVNIGNLTGSSFYGANFQNDQQLPAQSQELINQISGVVNWASLTNNNTLMKGVVYQSNTNTLQNLLGVFSINAVTNGMWGTNFWVGESNQSLVIIKYAGGVATYQTLMP